MTDQEKEEVISNGGWLDNVIYVMPPDLVRKFEDYLSEVQNQPSTICWTLPPVDVFVTPFPEFGEQPSYIDEVGPLSMQLPEVCSVEEIKSKLAGLIRFDRVSYTARKARVREDLRRLAQLNEEFNIDPESK